MKHKGRLYIVQALYQMDVAETELSRIVKDFPGWQKGLADPSIRAHFEAIVGDAAARKEQLDEVIAQHLPKDWPLTRLNKALLAVLRAGSSELVAAEGEDSLEIIRHYVDVAHDLLDEKTAAMANAVLDKIKDAQKDAQKGS